mgnify:CR=1 FL=1
MSRPRGNAVPVPFAVAFLLAAGPATIPASAQTIRGHLLDAESGAPIDLGLVIMETAAGDSVTSALTGRDGYFSITSPDPGSFTLLGSGLGYEETRAGVFDLGMGGELQVEFRLPLRPMPIDQILVELDREIFEHKLVRTGFVRRYQRDVGGHFVTPYDIERSPARSTEALLEPIPGIRAQPIHDENDFGPVGYVGEAVLLESRGGRCTPTIYVDGMRVRYQPQSGQTLTSYVPLHTVLAVEVYDSPADVPTEYNMTRVDDLCGVLVFWTR